MPKLKFLISIFLGLAVVIGQVVAVYAAPPQQDGTPITGTVQSVVVETSPESGVQTVVVALMVNGESQTVRLSVETATGLGLIVVDEMGNPVLDDEGNPVVDESIIGTDAEIDPTTIISDEPASEEKQHPVGANLAGFFSGLSGVDYEMIMSSHSDGLGFGIITQALWITQKLGGDATLFQNILVAKKSHDYTNVALPDGTIPQNWGQLKKAVLKGDDDTNLGDIMSNGSDDEPGNSGNDNGNGKPENPPGQTKDRNTDNNGNGKPETPPGQTKDRNTDNNGNGRPETPPGQTKDKNKDNNGNGKTK